MQQELVAAASAVVEKHLIPRVRQSHDNSERA